MKKRNLLNTACNMLLTLLLTGGTLGCMISAFGLSADTELLTLLILLFTVFACLCCTLPGGVPVVACSLVLVAPWLWKQDLAAHTEAFLWNMSRLYEETYDLGYTIWWTRDDHIGAPTTAFFCAVAMLLIFATASGLSKRRAWPGVTLALVLLTVCLAIPEAQFNIPCFFLALLAIGSMALSASVRRHSPGDAPAMTLTSVVAVATALALLITIVPQDSYIPKEGLSIQDLIGNIMDWLDPSVDPPSGQGGSSLSSKLSLTQIGPKERDDTQTFTVRTNYNGYIYLRGRSYEDYTGTAWQADPFLESALVMDESHDVSLKTYRLSLTYEKDAGNKRVLFIPWHPGHRNITGGVEENTSLRSDFTFNFEMPKTGWGGVIAQPASRYTAVQAQDHMRSYGYAPEAYLTLPKNSEIEAKVILQVLGISQSDSLHDTVSVIGRYVSTSAQYSLGTQQMPAGTDDFALWFLQQSNTGYCVHFASAAAVLLRAAGVPARYVEGYLFYSQANTDIAITEHRAHAWVEYYVPTLGWMILEATPSAGLPEELPDIPTESTTEPSTAPTTEPTTEPEPSTRPTKPSLPETTTPTTTPETQPSAPPATQPEGNAPVDPPADLSWLWTLLRGLAWIAGIAAVLIGQWKLRLALLLRWLHRGDPNTQALACWKHTCLLAKLRSQDPPNPLRDLAIKAKFSQHTLTAAELGQFEAYRAASIRHLRAQPLYLRLLYRLLWAIY